jgi:DNA repair protein RadC
MPRVPSPGRSRRYRRVAVTYTVAREQVSTSWPALSSLSASIVHPREVLGPALREGAAHLILVHNHPSGASRSM